MGCHSWGKWPIYIYIVPFIWTEQTIFIPNPDFASSNFLFEGTVTFSYILLDGTVQPLFCFLIYLIARQYHVHLNSVILGIIMRTSFCSFQSISLLCLTTATDCSVGMALNSAVVQYSKSALVLCTQPLQSERGQDKGKFALGKIKPTLSNWGKLRNLSRERGFIFKTVMQLKIIHS